MIRILDELKEYLKGKDVDKDILKEIDKFNKKEWKKIKERFKDEKRY
jgi:hypothetical protein